MYLHRSYVVVLNHISLVRIRSVILINIFQIQDALEGDVVLEKSIGTWLLVQNSVGTIRHMRH